MHILQLLKEYDCSDFCGIEKHLRTIKKKTYKTVSTIKLILLFALFEMFCVH